MPDENIPEVVVDDGAPEVEVQADPKVETKPTENAADAVEQLKKQLAERTESEKAAREEADRARRAAAEAEVRAREQAGQAQQATRVAQGHELDSVNNALGAAQREMEAIEGKLAAAMEAGEFGTVAKLQAQLGKQGARIVQLEEGKAYLEQRAKETPREPAPRTAEEQREAYISSRTPQTAAWLRANPRFFTDQQFRQKVEAADGYVANILNIPRDSPEYFAKIEETTGMRQAATSGAAETVSRSSEPAPAKPAPKPAAAAAPPSRVVPTAHENQQGNRITLSREEYDAAQWMFPRQRETDPAPEVLYAKHKRELMKEGKLLDTHGRPMGPQNI